MAVFSIRCSTALDKFIFNQQLKNNSEETIKYYKKRIGYFIDFVKNKKINRLKASDYEAYTMYLLQKKISDDTVKTSLTAVRVFFNFLYNENYIKTDIVSQLEKFKSGKKTIIVLSKEQIEQIYSYYNENTFYGARNLFLISLMLDSGLRVSEVINLKTTDINIELSSMKIHGKGNKDRIVPISPVTIYYYKNYSRFPHISDYLAVNICGGRLTDSGIRRLLLNLRDDLGFTTLYPHYLRHSFATWFLINGGDPESLRIILGHTTLYMTEIYLHIANEIMIAMNTKYSPLSNISYFLKKRIP